MFTIVTPAFSVSAQDSETARGSLLMLAQGFFASEVEREAGTGTTFAWEVFITDLVALPLNRTLLDPQGNRWGISY